jgi:hypothetical protein
MGKNPAAKLHQLLRRHVVFSVVGSPGADNEIWFGEIGMVIDCGKQGVLLLV